VRFPNIQLSPSKLVIFTRFSIGDKTLLFMGDGEEVGVVVGLVVGNLQKPSK
jgi:hypothetical protein